MAEIINKANLFQRKQVENLPADHPAFMKKDLFRASQLILGTLVVDLYNRYLNAPALETELESMQKQVDQEFHRRTAIGEVELVNTSVLGRWKKRITGFSLELQPVPGSFEVMLDIRPILEDVS